MKQNFKFMAIVEQDEDGWYIGTVPSLRSCYTQAKTLQELRIRLREVIELCLDVQRDYFEEDIQQNKFVCVEHLEVRA